MSRLTATFAVLLFLPAIGCAQVWTERRRDHR